MDSIMDAINPLHGGGRQSPVLVQIEPMMRRAHALAVVIQRGAIDETLRLLFHT
jgi:hypothetical protein